MRALLLILLIFVSDIMAGTIGWCPATSTNQQDYTDTMPQGMSVYYTYTPSVAETVVSVSIYADACGHPTEDEFEIAVYNITDGADSNAVLVDSAIITCPDNDLQVCTTSGLSWALTANDDYALAYKNNNADCRLMRNWGDNAAHLHDSLTGEDEFSSVWTDSPTTEGWDWEVCATTEAAPASGVNITPIYSHMINQ